ncbi:hypothetical protein SP60_06615 [Candidatus Thioglobus autotrophicus]|uniref:Uncharacterized protein n=1 Tax=Candidatus Thioglobus autotrophicus TaxID=1705394 RepID=A0A0M4NJM6_9GAMM|nr:hypothetical protein [Candidatus Thioglobus autotrophicus]ALE52900.1 hypothetical protein SP60_06615 [Candidatus Thioglobus autotrophicus]
MKERHIVGYTLLGSILAFLLIFLLTRDVEMPENQAMPWQSYLNEQGQTVVFELTMGRSQLIDAARQFGVEIEASLFEREHIEPELEVYFPSTKVGGIGANIILNLAVDAQHLEMLRKNIDQSMLMPSGVKKTTFTTTGEALMSHYQIKSLSFVPKTDLSEEVMLNLFGKPEQIESASPSVSYWHYPQKGLRIIVDDEHKEILEFFNQ